MTKKKNPSIKKKHIAFEEARAIIAKSGILLAGTGLGFGSELIDPGGVLKETFGPAFQELKTSIYPIATLQLIGTSEEIERKFGQVLDASRIILGLPALFNLIDDNKHKKEEKEIGGMLNVALFHLAILKDSAEHYESELEKNGLCFNPETRRAEIINKKGRPGDYISKIFVTIADGLKDKDSRGDLLNEARNRLLPFFAIPGLHISPGGRLSKAIENSGILKNKPTP